MKLSKYNLHYNLWAKNYFFNRLDFICPGELIVDDISGYNEYGLVISNVNNVIQILWAIV